VAVSDVVTGPGFELRCGRWEEALADVERVDAVITDPPYSERTHSSYREMPNIGRRSIDYGAWSPDDARAFVAHWSPRCAGWMGIITDHVLAPVVEWAMVDQGRYAFAPLAYVAPGSRVRICGDGPANWACWIVVSRPATRGFATWGALPGAYVLPPGANDLHATLRKDEFVTGGKPLWLMRELVRHYTRPGDSIIDPCAGAGTTLLAAVLEGRRAIGSEMDPETFAKAAARLERETRDRVYVERPGEAPKMKQQALDLEAAQ
jgi:site-specific DNA-methyltransferase (adenine-specific)